MSTKWRKINRTLEKHRTASFAKTCILIVFIAFLLLQTCFFLTMAGFLILALGFAANLVWSLLWASGFILFTPSVGKIRYPSAILFMGLAVGLWIFGNERDYISSFLGGYISLEGYLLLMSSWFIGAGSAVSRLLVVYALKPNPYTTSQSM